MQKVLIAFLITFVLVVSSYLVNNNHQCCDQIFQAGWPFPFYGGSGGFVGMSMKENKIILDGLLKNVLFWFVVSYGTLLLPLIYKKLLQK